MADIRTSERDRRVEGYDHECRLPGPRADAGLGPRRCHHRFFLSSYLNVKYGGVAQDDIVVMLLSDYGVKLYGNAIMVNPAFAAEKPEAVKAFLRAFLRALKYTAKNPDDAINSVMKWNETAKREVEFDRLAIALRDNILTPEVKKNGFGAVDMARLIDRADRADLPVQRRKAEGVERVRPLVPAGGRGARQRLRAPLSSVIVGLGPAIHPSSQEALLAKMDPRDESAFTRVFNALARGDASACASAASI